MYNSIHPKKNKVLIKLTDGSSVCILCYSLKKEIVSSFDSRLYYFWLDSKFAINPLTNNKNNFYKKFSFI